MNFRFFFSFLNIPPIVYSPNAERRKQIQRPSLDTFKPLGNI